ncbi:kinase-like protein [Marasmius fiardii PR-910]|nr:kinase-like protein [Marasmius fiardii PR-910]
MFIEEKGFMDQFLRSNQGMGYIEYSPWALTSFSPPSPYRTMSYIKPLDNEPFNVKATDCDIRITIVHEDSTDYTSAILSTTCHDVPSSRDFTIQTRICIMWESLGVTRMIVTTQVEWSGPSYIKDIVERASFEGQQSYYEALHREMTRHIYAHRDEFIPSGVNCNTLPVRCTGCLGLFTVGDTNLDTSTHVLDDDSEMESPIEHDVYGSDLTSCALCGERVHEAPSPVTEDAPTFSGSSTTVVAVESRSAEEVLNVNTADDLQRVLALKNGVDIILTLEDSLVSSTLDLLQSEIRTTVSDPGLYEYRRKCTKCLRGLVNKHHVLPNSLFVNDIVREGSHPVGGGGFSDIWKGTYGDQAVCLKVLRVHIQSNQGKKDKIVREFYKEALLWTQFSHPNLLPFLGVNTELFPQGFCLVSPWMITEIAAGMSYLHSLKVVHGDIKGANVLVDARGVCHLADFGLAITTAETTALFNSTTSATKGSLRWMAPELFNLGIGDLMGAGEEKPNELGRDIYAYACTVLEIITGKPPFPDLIDTMVMFQVAVNGARPPRPTAVTWCPDNIWALVQLCWAQQICLRPAASGVHSYLERLVDARRSGLPWEQEFPQLVVES